jgi:NAD(P)-dependent dehydrogenase (short-subunit alcohol dehydrogenase family)
MNNKIALITGANSGVGLATAKGLAAAGFDLILLVRSHAKAKTTQEILLQSFPDTKIDYEIADLEDIESVKKAVQQIRKRYIKIDRIINNAGYSPDTIAFTKDGYEKSFATNHLGHFALTINLLDILEASGEGRIINVSSAAHGLGKVSRFLIKNNKNLTAFKAYGDGKLANILFTKGLMKRLAGKPILAFSLHPGVVGTNFGGNFTGFSSLLMSLAKPFMISSEEGAKTSIFLATAPLENIKRNNGKYFVKCKVKSTNSNDITTDNANWLWEKSLEIVND